jgi:serine/threonine protein kinase/tetratricopeptide (TPR) repeat protein
MPDVPSQLQAALADRYRLDRMLGQGGMATVYLAQDLKHPRQVAIKVLRPELASMLGPERFAREIQVLAALSHPHILPLFDSGEADGQLFYVMPFIRGESLQHKLARERQLDIAEAVSIIRQVASALDHAHAQGLVHRDIKPENILLHEGEAMLADFGIALDAAATGPGKRITATGLSLGTPAYMSPEQVAGEATLDPRSDVYALGCLLYELLAGEPPFTGPTAQAIMAKRFSQSAPQVRRLRPAVPLAVERALTRAMAQAPADRFPSAGAFGEALVASPPSDPGPPSVAVLPFLNMSADPENEFFADGITEDVIAQLSKIRSLKVISRASVMPFKKREQGLGEIAATLAVGTIVDGSVRKAGDRVRIVAQLLDPATDRTLWSETYDRQLTDIFAIQSDVALQIATALKAELTKEEETRIQREPTRNLAAYQLYLQARHWYTRYNDEGFRKAIQYYEEAIAADPGYAEAHAGLALTYAEFAAGMGGSSMKEEVAYGKAYDAVKRALELGPSLGDAHAVLAILKCTQEFDWVGAEREFKLALELNPGSADTWDHYGWLCYAQERYDEALELVKRAQELDPMAHRTDVVTALLRAGRNAEALEAGLKSVEFEPNFARARAVLGWAYIKNGQPEKGLAELETALKISPTSTMTLAQLGQAYAVCGRRDKAHEVLGRLGEMSKEQYVSPYHLAYIYTGLGELDRAMDMLEQSHRERAGGVYGIKGSFLFAPLRSHPRFKALLAKMNLA